MLPREKIDMTNYKRYPKMRILFNSAEFSAGRPLLPVYIYWATMASIPLALIAWGCGLLDIFGD